MAHSILANDKEELSLVTTDEEKNMYTASDITPLFEGDKKILKRIIATMQLHEVVLKARADDAES